MGDTLVLHDGTVLTGVHLPSQCLLENCCIHNPSDHPLNTAPLTWIGGEIRTMGRVCEHGFYHPDPDDLAFKIATLEWMTAEAIASVHLVEENCDGCCVSPKDKEDK